MKIWMLAMVVALGCKSKAPAAGKAVPEERPTVADPMGYCARARHVIQARQKCFPEDASLKMSLDDLQEKEATAPAQAEARRKVAAECAVMLDSMMRVQQPKDCPLDVTDSERAELSAFLTAWYGERTAAPTTSNASLDTAVGEVAAQRDAVCACKTGDCARAAIAALDKLISALPASVPTEVSDATAKMTDEAARCKQRIVFGAPAAL